MFLLFSHGSGKMCIRDRDKIRPAYDFTYKVVLFICKILLIADILITCLLYTSRCV